MIKAIETSETINREHSLSFEGVGRNIKRNPFVLKVGLNFHVFLRFDLEVLRVGRRPWNLFSLF